MKKSIVGAVIVSALIAPVASAQVKRAAIDIGEAEAVVKVVSVDRKTRTVLVQGPSGASLPIQVPAEAQNLDQVKPGDLFRMRYAEAVALALNKGGKSSASEVQTVELAPKGGTPGGKVVSTRQLTATVRGLDRGARTMTLVGPGGKGATVKVAQEVQGFDDVGVGDTITIAYTQAVAMEMIREPAAKKAP